jgi:hypothetical protein
LIEKTVAQTVSGIRDKHVDGASHFPRDFIQLIDAFGRSKVSLDDPNLCLLDCERTCCVVNLGGIGSYDEIIPFRWRPTVTMARVSNCLSSWLRS